MGLPINAETRTGDTPTSKRQRQRRRPPHLLMTTPESLSLLLSYADAGRIFRDLQVVIVDELHALETNKRGDMLALGLASLANLAPNCRRIGLSATVAEPAPTRALAVLRQWRAPHYRRRGCHAPGLDPPARHRDPLVGAHGGACGAGNLRTDQGRRHHADLRQHPRPGRDHLPGAVAPERRPSVHRRASRQPVCGAAAQGRGGDGGRAAQGRGRHLLPRSRRRLGGRWIWWCRWGRPRG